MHAEALESAHLSSDEEFILESDGSAVPGTVGSAGASGVEFAASYGAQRFDFAGKVNQAKYLLPDAIRKGDGVGPVVALEESCSKLLVVTLDITNVVERTGLTVSVWGSPDGMDWGTKPLVTFRQRQYCGVYSVLLNMATHPNIRHVRVHWSMNRWGKTAHTPLFGFEVFTEESGARISNPAFA